MNGIYLFLISSSLLFALLENGGIKLHKYLKYIYVSMMIVLTGFRQDAGADYINYVHIFDNIQMYEEHLEVLFILLCKFLNYLNLDVQVLFLICSILTVLPIAFVLLKMYPQYFFTGIAVYIDTFIFFEGWNTVRQAVSMSFALLGIYYLLQNIDNHNQKWMRRVGAPLGCFLVAFGFHQSVIVVIPLMVWIVLRKPKKRKNTLLLFLIVTSYVFGLIGFHYFKQLQSYLPSMFSNSGYWSQIEQRGVNSGAFHIYLNISAVALILYVTTMDKKFQYCNLNKNVQFYVTMVVIYNLFINFYIGLRFYWYFYLLMILLIPEIFCTICKRNKPLFLLLSLGVPVIYSIISLQGETYSNLSFVWRVFK